MPVIACNVDVSGEPDFVNTPLMPSVVLQRGKFTIGVIGYLTPETSVSLIQFYISTFFCVPHAILFLGFI